jgi:hypothetical protein
MWLFPNMGNYATGGDRGEKVPPAGAVHLDLRGRMVGQVDDLRFLQIFTVLIICEK